MTPSPALLIGNGPNVLGNPAYSWAAVLAQLGSHCNRPDLPTAAQTKPFTLVYEELVLSRAEYALAEDRLKGTVADSLSVLEPSETHRRLMRLGVKHVLTTNYDSNLERASGLRRTPKSTRSETRYSLFRRWKVGGTSVWHMHGDAEKPETIALGHDHYVGYLTKARNYLRHEHDRPRSHPFDYRSPVVHGQSQFEGHGAVYSWIDVFLRDDLHIAGFGFDYSEIAIWWLLTYKRRLSLNHPRTPKRVAVGSTWYYHTYPAQLAPEDEAKLALLRRLGVNVRLVDCGPDWCDGEGGYARMIDMIAQSI